MGCEMSGDFPPISLPERGIHPVPLRASQQSCEEDSKAWGLAPFHSWGNWFVSLPKATQGSQSFLLHHCGPSQRLREQMVRGG